jgi:FdhE protein
MRYSWQRRIDRAAELAERAEAAGPLLFAYRRMLGLQQDCYEALRRDPGRLTGSLDRDLPAIRGCIPPMLNALATTGPARVADEARRLLDGGDSAIDGVLLTAWRASSPAFCARIVLQPYAECLAATGLRPIGRHLPQSHAACPFCGGPPQLSILESPAGAEGGGRHLLCATCSTTWPFRRVLCAHCGEEDEHRLSYFHSPAFDHLRVDTCDTCKRYLKTVDLTRLGIAVPVVDEVAGAPLDLWALERGFEKIELNLVGL